MEFETVAQRACYERIAPWMQELFGAFVEAHPEVPAFVMYFGSASAQTVVSPWGDDDATITTRSYVVQGADLVPDLLHYLLRKTADMRFGAFGLDEQGRIVFEHTLIGATCDRTELKTSILAVVNVADRADDEIVTRWGGVRALDRATLAPTGQR
ncbi:MAG: YbjN domain-containing protein [Chloroflexi bacterium]|nr:YbjN domain-containing protein [Chloroflexota bacterium]